MFLVCVWNPTTPENRTPERLALIHFITFKLYVSICSLDFLCQIDLITDRVSEFGPVSITQDGFPSCLAFRSAKRRNVSETFWLSSADERWSVVAAEAPWRSFGLKRIWYVAPRPSRPGFCWNRGIECLSLTMLLSPPDRRQRDWETERRNDIISIVYIWQVLKGRTLVNV